MHSKPLFINAVLRYNSYFSAEVDALPSNLVEDVPCVWDLTEMEYPGKEIAHYNPLRGDFDTVGLACP